MIAKLIIIIFILIASIVGNVQLFLNDENYEVIHAQSLVDNVASLPCISSSSLKPDYNKTIRTTLVIWYKYGISAPVYSFDVRNKEITIGNHWSNGEVFGARAFYNPESSVLSLEGVKEIDSGIYKCRIDFDKAPTKNYLINLTVIVPPQELTVVDISGTNTLKSGVSSIREGQPLKLVCTAHGGRPAPQVRWLWNNSLFDDRMDVVIQNQVQNILYIEKVERKHYGSVLKCEAFNSYDQIPITTSLVLEIFLKPLSVRIVNEEELMNLSENKTYEIICESMGSKPPANITWFLQGKQLPSSLSKMKITHKENNTKSVLRFTPKSKNNGQKLTCKANNNFIFASALTDAKELNVKYRPILKVVLGSNLNESAIKEGIDVYFECLIDSNPSWRKVYWTHNGQILNAHSPGIITSNQNLVLQTVSRHSGGNYSCIALNDQGESQSEPFYLNVRYEPRCDTNQQHVYGAIRHEMIQISCNVHSNPKAHSYKWYFNNSLIITTPRSGNVQLLQSKNTSVTYYQPKTELDYGTLLCWATNEIGTQIVPCVYHIIPAGKPDAPNNCSVQNISETSLEIKCESGFDGGLPQEFVCEVIQSHSPHRLLWNITNHHLPIFRITALEQDTKYYIKIYSTNGKGPSSSSVQLNITTSVHLSEKRIRTLDESYPKFWVVILCGVLGGLLCLLICLIFIIIRVRKHSMEKAHKKPDGTNIDNTPTLSDDGISPDIIPQIQETCDRGSGSDIPNLTDYSENNTSYRHVNCNSVQYDQLNSMHNNYKPDAHEHTCNSVVFWTQPRRCNNEGKVSMAVFPYCDDNYSMLKYYYDEGRSQLPHKESQV